MMQGTSHVDVESVFALGMGMGQLECEVFQSVRYSDLFLFYSLQPVFTCNDM